MVCSSTMTFVVYRITTIFLLSGAPSPLEAVLNRVLILDLVLETPQIWSLSRRFDDIGSILRFRLSTSKSSKNLEKLQIRA